MSKRAYAIQILLISLCFLAMAFVLPDTRPVNALPAVKVSVAEGCNSCHDIGR